MSKQTPIQKLRNYSHKYHSASIVDVGFGMFECNPYSRFRALKIMDKAVRLGLSVEYNNYNGQLKISY